MVWIALNLVNEFKARHLTAVVDITLLLKISSKYGRDSSKYVRDSSKYVRDSSKYVRENSLLNPFSCFVGRFRQREVKNLTAVS